MCNRAAALLKPEALGQLKLSSFGVDVLPRPNIAPTDPLPVVVHDGQGGLALVTASWGKPDSAIATMNARDDRLLESPMWSPLLANKRTRGVIVLSHGFEPFTKLTMEQMGPEVARANVGEQAIKEAVAGKTVWHGFKRRDGQPMLVAALVDIDDQQRRWATMVTTHAGPVFSRIHRAKAHGEEREVASLRNADEVNEWMSGALDYKHLLRGAGDDFMESWRCPPDCMKKDADPLLKTQTWVPTIEKQRTLF
jgi:putative SOS response-associated peptidase YedK